MNGPDGVQYLLTDHLGSVAAVADASGDLLSEQRYLPFGSARLDELTETDFSYTGQRNLASIDLMDYNARWYDAGLGRFMQPDTLVPETNKPQAWNRFAYVYNNPIKHNDPTGHCIPFCTAAIGVLVGAAISIGVQAATTGEVDWGEVAVSAAVGAISGATVGLGTGLAATVFIGAGTGVAAGQVARAGRNVIQGKKITTGLFKPKRHVA